MLNTLRGDLGAQPEAVTRWMTRWIADGFTALEVQIARNGAGYAYGDTPTLADCFLVPQVYSAERFKVDLAPFPHIRGAAERARVLPAFQAAHPDRQQDAELT